MISGELEESEKRDIQAQVAKILRDLGNPEPPLDLASVRSLLSLNLEYYSSTDPGLIAEIEHRFRLLVHKSIPDVGKKLLSALSKSKLCAFWVPESSRILIDSTVPDLRKRWIEAHEIIHSVTPWHREFLLGDNRETLDPACHAVIEAEANYGAGKLLSLGNRLPMESRDLDLSFASIQKLAKRYGNSVVSTFWRVVEERDSKQPVFGVISIHPLHPEVGSHDGTHPWRYFIRSEAFRNNFAAVDPQAAYDLIVKYATYKKVGPIFSATHVLADAADQLWEFRLESFSTKHAVLTFGYPLRKYSAQVMVIERV